MIPECTGGFGNVAVAKTRILQGSTLNIDRPVEGKASVPMLHPSLDADGSGREVIREGASACTTPARGCSRSSALPKSCSEALRSVRLSVPLSTTQRYALHHEGKVSSLTELKGDCL